MAAQNSRAAPTPARLDSARATHLLESKFLRMRWKTSSPIGDAMFFSAGLMWAGFSILTKRWSISPLAATAAVSVLSALIYVPVHFVVFGWQQLLSTPIAMLTIQVLVQGVISGVVAVIAFAKAIQLIGPARAAIFPAFVPAAALIIGIPITGEVPTLLQTGGLSMVTLGLLLAIVSR